MVPSRSCCASAGHTDCATHVAGRRHDGDARHAGQVTAECAFEIVQLEIQNEVTAACSFEIVQLEIQNKVTAACAFEIGQLELQNKVTAECASS